MLKMKQQNSDQKYKVKVKSEQSTHRWSDFETLRLQISVGQPYHEDEKFKATIEWAKTRFKRIIICVNDVLQRYNTLISDKNYSEEEAVDEQRIEGAAWLQRNAEALRETGSCQIFNWDYWLSHEQYAQTLSQIYALYENNFSFQQSIDQNIDTIWQRKLKNRQVNFDDYARFKELSKQYLLEEISVFSIMYDEEEAIDVYPGSVLFAATFFQGQESPDMPRGLGKGKFCRIDFARSPNP